MGDHPVKAGRRGAGRGDTGSSGCRIQLPDGSSVQIRYNAQGLVSQRQDPGGAAWQYSYDAHGNLLGETDPLGKTTRFCYDHPSLPDRPTTVIDASGSRSRTIRRRRLVGMASSTAISTAIAVNQRGETSAPIFVRLAVN
mgnify:CR=1 FL=1